MYIYIHSDTQYICIQIYICIYICLNVYIYIYTHIYICTLKVKVLVAQSCLPETITILLISYILIQNKKFFKNK